jgi:hypothetical protein
VNEYDRHDTFLAIERLTKSPDTWEVAGDVRDWTTTAKWEPILANGKPKPSKPPRNNLLDLAPPRYAAKPDPFQVTITWESPADAKPGVYRIAHFGRCKEAGSVRRFTTRTEPFEIGR